MFAIHLLYSPGWVLFILANDEYSTKRRQDLSAAHWPSGAGRRGAAAGGRADRIPHLPGELRAVPGGRVKMLYIIADGTIVISQKTAEGEQERIIRVGGRGESGRRDGADPERAAGRHGAHHRMHCARDGEAGLRDHPQPQPRMPSISSASRLTASGLTTGLQSKSFRRPTRCCASWTATSWSSS